ncbi:hypothetical protein DPX16_1700 [Anabarilius grahami]|uniref:Uncharacterized protein n=1 Tax=Anabarilius grahami TaxID=495550 RepID=A0A3N0XJ63_ANAGA|nr:hypothetical protein DPX16_1700 [Anabarilius grahami]
MWAALNDWRECWHVAAMHQVQEAQEKQHGFAERQESSGQGRCLDRVKRFQLDLQTLDSRHELMRAGRQDRDRAAAAGRAGEENKHRKYSLRLSSEDILAAAIQTQNGNMKVKQLLAARA